MSAWAWPQWVMIGVVALAILLTIGENGKYQGLDILIWVAIAWVLWMGGFWP